MRLLIPTKGRTTSQLTLQAIPRECWNDSSCPVILCAHTEEVSTLRRNYPGATVYEIPETVVGYRAVMQHLWDRHSQERFIYCDDDITAFKSRRYDPAAEQRVTTCDLDADGWRKMVADLDLYLDDPTMGIVQPAPAWRIPALNSWPVRWNTQAVQFMAVDGPRLKPLKLSWNHTTRCPDASVCLQVLSSGFKTAQLQQYKMQVSPMFQPGGNLGNNDHAASREQLEISSHQEMLRRYPLWVKPNPKKPGYARYYWSRAFKSHAR